MTDVFETERLLLSPTSEVDAPFILELLNSPTWIKYIGDRNIKTIADAQQFIQDKIVTHYEKKGFGTCTVIRKSDNAKMGTCGLYTRDGIDGADIGFAFLPQYEKNGYAFEASNQIIDLAINKYELSYLNAYTTAENTSSQKLLEKLDFILKGTTTLPTQPDEMLLYKRTL